MNKDELFNEFWRSYESAAGGGSSPSIAKRLFSEVVIPHLAIPRSLKDDPPKDGERVILLYLELDHTTDIRTWPNISDSLRHEITNGRLTHWISAPVLSPQPDKDEQEFEEWIAKHPEYKLAKFHLKKGWMASRGKR